MAGERVSGAGAPGGSADRAPTRTNSPTAPPEGAALAAAPLTHRQVVTILIGLMLGMFLAALDQTVVATSIRVIADDLHGFSLQAWATTAFLITSTIATPLYGKLSDIYGRKPYFLFAIAVFIAGSALCGVAQSMYQLAAFRAIQGIGAGGLFSLAFATIGDIVAPRERARYQGYFVAVFGTSSIVGPIVGGFFAGASSILGVAGWRWIFWINVPIALAALVVVTKVLHLPHARQNHRVDWPGALALITCLVPLLVVAEQGRTWGWRSGPALLCYAVGAAGLVAFLWCEHRYGDEALLPLRLFRGRTFAVGTATSAIIGMGMLGGMLLLPLYLQIVRGASPTRAGLELVPLVAGIATGSILSGQVIARTGRYRVLPIAGIALFAVALFLFAFVGADTALWQVVAVMILLGLGLGGTLQPTVLAVQNAASPQEIGVSTSAVTFFRSMGGTVGAAVFLSILFSLLPERIRSAYAEAAGTPPFQAALREPGQAELLTQATGGAGLDNTSFLAQLAAPLAHPFKVGFSESMNTAFLVATLIMVVGLAVMWFLPELPLRRGSAAEERAAEARAASDQG